jgi:CSLREA domain-containing protein
LLALLAGLVLLLALTSGPARAATAFTVNKTGDAKDRRINGVCDASPLRGIQCTLRAAIQEANATANSGGPDEINFAIGGTATVKTISPARPLPAITESVTIDGYTQGTNTATTSDDAKPNDNPFTFDEGTDAVIKVRIKGTNAGASANGLKISASSSTIKGLSINRFAQSGILLEGSGATGNKVEGNFIGTDASGTLALPNVGNGVYISGAPSNSIGGPQAAQTNVISGNGQSGVEISDSEATANKVERNYIGTDASGTQDLGNSLDGVHIKDAPNNTIGGSLFPNDGSNLISGNDSDGVAISGTGATGNRVLSNLIGLKASLNEVPLGNSGHGVHIDNASNSTIGPYNEIAMSGGDGVFVASGTGNRILSNTIYRNSGLGIDLSGGTEDSFGVTANDEDDPDTGANSLQNFPIITSATRDSNAFMTTVSGTLNSTPNQTFLIEFYAVGGHGEEEFESSNHGEGDWVWLEKGVRTDANGNASFTFEEPDPTTPIITATATNTATGDTSEFSEYVFVDVS